MSGFFLIRRSHLDDFQTSVKGFKIGLELFVRSQPRRLAEVGYVFVGRSAGESKMSLAEGTGFLRQLASLYRDSLAAPVRRPGVRHHSQPVRSAPRQRRCRAPDASARVIHMRAPAEQRDHHAAGRRAEPVRDGALERGDRRRRRQIDAERHQPRHETALDRPSPAIAGTDAAEHGENRERGDLRRRQH